MRRLFTTTEARAGGLTMSALVWGERVGRWRRVAHGVYAEGPDDVSPLDQERARVLATSSVGRGTLAGVLHGLDSVELDGRPLRREMLPADRVVETGGIPCANGLQTLIDLAAVVDDAVWEQALESALRKRLTSIAELEDAMPELRRARLAGVARIRRVLALRPPDAPPTESLLETLMVQLARTVDGLPEPTRQLVVYDRHGNFVARVDLCWPELGIFVELDGRHHEGQPLYDARRQTAVVAATGSLTARFTWHEVVHIPRTTARRLAELASLARQRN